MVKVVALKEDSYCDPLLMVTRLYILNIDIMFPIPNVQALDPLQFKAVIVLTDNVDAASGGDLDGIHVRLCVICLFVCVCVSVCVCVFQLET